MIRSFIYLLYDYKKFNCKINNKAVALVNSSYQGTAMEEHILLVSLFVYMNDIGYN